MLFVSALFFCNLILLLQIFVDAVATKIPKLKVNITNNQKYGHSFIYTVFHMNIFRPFCLAVIFVIVYKESSVVFLGDVLVAKISGSGSRNLSKTTLLKLKHSLLFGIFFICDRHQLSGQYSGMRGCPIRWLSSFRSSG